MVISDGSDGFVFRLLVKKKEVKPKAKLVKKKAGQDPNKPKRRPNAFFLVFRHFFMDIYIYIFIIWF